MTNTSPRKGLDAFLAVTSLTALTVWGGSVARAQDITQAQAKQYQMIQAQEAQGEAYDRSVAKIPDSCRRDTTPHSNDPAQANAYLYQECVREINKLGDDIAAMKRNASASSTEKSDIEEEMVRISLDHVVVQEIMDDMNDLKANSTAAKTFVQRVSTVSPIRYPDTLILRRAAPPKNLLNKLKSVSLAASADYTKKASPAPSENPFYYGNWAGVQVDQYGLAGYVTILFNTWTVDITCPSDLTPPNGEEKNWNSVWKISSWGGVTGAGLAGSYGYDLVQAGLDMWARSKSGKVTTGCSAWTEEFPKPPTPVNDFIVKPGEKVRIIGTVTGLNPVTMQYTFINGPHSVTVNDTTTDTSYEPLAGGLDTEAITERLCLYYEDGTETGRCLPAPMTGTSGSKEAVYPTAYKWGANIAYFANASDCVLSPCTEDEAVTSNKDVN